MPTQKDGNATPTIVTTDIDKRAHKKLLHALHGQIDSKFCLLLCNNTAKRLAKSGCCVVEKAHDEISLPLRGRHEVGSGRLPLEGYI